MASTSTSISLKQRLSSGQIPLPPPPINSKTATNFIYLALAAERLVSVWDLEVKVEEQN